MTMQGEVKALIEGGNFTPPQVEVIGGPQGSTDRMDPSVMNFLLLASMVSQTVRTRKLLEDTISEGWMKPYTVPVTAVVSETLMDEPAQSLSLVNDGPGVVMLEINDRRHSFITVNANQPFQIDFRGHKLNRFYLYCLPGVTATVRVAVKG
jgi:hypothetical protein